MRACPESPRMFENDFLDGLSRTPWWTVPLLWLPASTAMLVYGIVGRGVPVGRALAVAAVGWFVWTFVEYVLHRTVFHWQPGGRWGERFHFYVHGVHHQWVKDPYRLVMPPAVSLVLSVVFFGLFRPLLGATWVWPFYGGFVFGYLVYDMMHYAEHHARYPFALGKRGFARLKAHHIKHHFATPDRRFGVSTRLWDKVFGTA